MNAKNMPGQPSFISWEEPCAYSFRHLLPEGSEGSTAG